MFENVDDTQASLDSQAASAIAEESRDIIKGMANKLDYLYVVLKNGLRVVIVHNPRIEVESVMAEVGVGFRDDDFVGTAHLVHQILGEMVTDLASTRDVEPRPQWSNGTTDTTGQMRADITNFFLKTPINQSDAFLDDTIAILTQLCTQGSLDHKIDKRMIKQAQCRFNKKTTHNEHLAFEYMPGVAQKKKISKLLAEKGDVEFRAELTKLYKKYYVPNNIILVVYTFRDIDKIKNVVAAKFGVLERGEAVHRDEIQCHFPDLFSQILWLDQQYHDKWRNMYITYILPESCLDAEASPEIYVEEMFEYDGAGSLQHFLKSEGISDPFTATFTYNSTHKYGKFEIDGLLEKPENYEKAIAAVIAYIELIKEAPVNMQLLEEIYHELRLHFNRNDFVKTPDKDTEDTEDIAAYLNDYGFKKMLSGGYLVEKVDPEAVTRFLDMFSDNFFVTILCDDITQAACAQHPEVTNGKKYNKEYRMLKYTRNEEMIKSMKQKMRVEYNRPVNNMLVTDLTLKDRVSADMLPTLLVDNDRHKMWHAMSSVKIAYPLALWFGFVFKSKYSMLSAKNSAVMNVLNRLLCSLVSTNLKEALDARYDFETEIWAGVFKIYVWGYSQKMECFMMSVIEQMTKSSFDQALLETAKESCKDTLGRECCIVNEDDWYFYEDGYSKYLLNTGHYSPWEMLEHVDAITVDDVLECANAFFGSATLDVLMYGNVYSDEALVMYKRAVDVIARRYPQRDVFEFDVRRVQNIQPILYMQTDYQEQHVYISLLIDKDSPRVALLSRLFIQMLTSAEYGKRLGSSYGCIYSTIEITYFESSCRKSVLRMYDKINATLDEDAEKMIDFVQSKGLGRFTKMVAYDLIDIEFYDLIKKIVDGSYNFKDVFAWRELLEQITVQEFVDFVRANVIKRRYSCVMIVDRDQADDLDWLRTDENGTQRVLVELNAKSIAEWRDEHALASDLESQMSIR